MSEIIWFGALIWLVAYFVIKVVENNSGNRNKIPSAKEIRKETLERVALKNKYHNQVPPTTKDGQPYTTIKQAYDKVGVYSKEYYEERKKLDEEFKNSSSKK